MKTFALWLTFVLYIPGWINFALPSRAPIVYTIDTKKSTIRWTGYYVFNFGEHQGTLELASGKIQVDSSRILGGHFEMDMTTIKDLDMPADDGGKDLEQHLKSQDFFDTDQFPRARFEIISVTSNPDTPREAQQFDVTGDLSIKGTTKRLVFPARIVFDANGLTATAKFKFDRTNWNIRYNSGRFFADIGDGAISDAIALEINLVAAP